MTAGAVEVLRGGVRAAAHAVTASGTAASTSMYASSETSCLRGCRKQSRHTLLQRCAKSWVNCFFFLLLLSVGAAHAAIDPYQFKDEEQRERYQHFVAELRCPKCQNQNLAGSDAPVATDLRRELHRLIVEGKSDREVVDYMVDRYGEFILYRPPLDRRTAALWALPAVLLLIGAVVIALIVRRHRRAPASAPLDAAERARVEALLNESRESEQGTRRP